MPYRLRARDFVAPKQGLEVDFNLIYGRLVQAIVRGVNTTVIRAHATAQRKAPVRKVFMVRHTRYGREVGGHRVLQTLTPEQLRAELPAFMRAFPPPTPTTRSQILATRQGVRTTLVPHRPNTWANSQSRRNVSLEGGFLEEVENTALTGRPIRGQYHLRPEDERDLSVRGQSELRTGRAVFKGKLGGALRASVKYEVAHEADQPQFKASVRAGGMVHDGHGHSVHVDYAKYVEFGTRHAPAQPFLRPALAEARTYFRSELIASLKRA